MGKCIECKKRPVHVLKRKLCSACYQRLRKTFFGNVVSQKRLCDIGFKSEIEFIKNFFIHSNWVYHPVIFHLKGMNYEPDFYDGERDYFIEVAGTRQAFYKNKKKYQLFRNSFPKIKFEIRYSNGNLLKDGKFQNSINNSTIV